ncbi:hypothetical protein LINPERHAP2_LOCUS34143 [Linum perenne]
MAEDEGNNRPLRDYKIWTDEEICVFIKAMLDLVELEQIHGCTLKADAHIKSKHRFFKDKFLAQLELKNVSEFGWDDSRAYTKEGSLFMSSARSKSSLGNKLQATRKLINDDGEAATYFKMRTNAEKVESSTYSSCCSDVVMCRWMD